MSAPLQMPRTHHIGVKGTFMDAKTHAAYFANITTSTDPSVDWASDTGACASLLLLHSSSRARTH